MQHIRIKFTKGEPVKFISHLDLMRVFERAVRRAEIPIKYSEGFNPQPRISFGIPTSVGMASLSEYADFDLESWMNPQQFKDKLNASLPKDIRILEAKIISPKELSLSSTLNRAVYDVTVKSIGEDFNSRSDGLEQQIDRLLQLKEIIIEKKKKGEIKKVDIRPMIYGLQVTGNGLKMELRVGSKGSVKPEEVVSQLEGFEIEGILRTGLFGAPKEYGPHPER